MVDNPTTLRQFLKALSIHPAIDLTLSFWFGLELLLLPVAALAQPIPSVGSARGGTTNSLTPIAGQLDGAAYYKSLGGIVGSGQSAGQRATNCTQINATITYAQTNNLWLQWADGIYEISCSTGILVPPQTAGFTMVGGLGVGGTVFRQFYTTSPGAPVMVIGNGSTLSNGLHIDGFTLDYGAGQAGNTSAVAASIGDVTQSMIDNIYMDGNTTGNFPYNAVAMTGPFFYSNTLRNWFIYGWQNDGLAFNAAGSTGNDWHNFYFSDASTLMTGSFLDVIAAGQDQHFDRWNFEGGLVGGGTSGGSGGYLVKATSGSFQGAVFTALHVEGVGFTGFNPGMFNLSGDSVLVNGVEVVNPTINANMSGDFFLVNDYTQGTGGASIAHVNNIAFVLNAQNIVTKPIAMINLAGGNLGDSMPIMEVNQAQFMDNSGSGTNQFKGHVMFDNQIAVDANKQIKAFRSYTYRPVGSLIDQMEAVVAATDTLYCEFENSAIDVPATITSFTLTLAPTMSSAATQPCRSGNTAHVRRMAGTASGTLTVTNGGQSGGNLTAPATAASDNFYAVLPYVAAAAADATAVDWINLTTVP